jgi:hypothetical protein
MACTAMHGAVAASPWRACQGSLAPRSLGVHAYLRRGIAEAARPSPPCSLAPPHSGAKSRALSALPPSGSPPRDASGAGRRRKEVHKAKLQLHHQPLRESTPAALPPVSTPSRPPAPPAAPSDSSRLRPHPPSVSTPHLVPHTSSTPCAPCLSPSSLEPPAIWTPWPPASPVLSWTEGRSQDGLHLDPWSSW